MTKDEFRNCQKVREKSDHKEYKMTKEEIIQKIKKLLLYSLDTLIKLSYSII